MPRPVGFLTKTIRFFMAMSRIQLSQDWLLDDVSEITGRPDQVGAAAEMLAGGDGKFPSGIRSLPLDLVVAVQRERLLAATLRATAEFGYRESASRTCSTAGVSRPTFYEHFENKEDCFLAALDAVARFGYARDSTPFPSEDTRSWRDGFASSSKSSCALSRRARRRDDAHRRRPRRLPGGSGAPRRAPRPLRRLHRPAGARQLPELPPPSAISAAGIVGGIEAVLYSRLQRERLATTRSPAVPDVLRGPALRGARGGERRDDTATAVS